MSNANNDNRANVDTLIEQLKQVPDGPSVGQLLGCRRKRTSPSVNDLLICSTELASQLLKHVFDAAVSSSLDTTVVQKLLLCPSVYETPWETAVTLTRYVQQNEHHCVPLTPLHTFLQQTAAYWWDEERKQQSYTIEYKKKRVKPGIGEALVDRTPRVWIVDLVETLLRPFLINRASDLQANPRCCNSKNAHPKCIEILQTILSLAKDLDKPLLDAVLSHVLTKEIRPECAADWVELMESNRVLLQECGSQNVWETVQTVIHSVLKNRPGVVSNQDMIKLAQSVVALGSFSLCQKGSKKNVQPWCNLLLQLLCHVSPDYRLYLEVERAAESAFYEMPSGDLQAWMNVYLPCSDDNDTSGPVSEPSWVEASVLILLRRVINQSDNQIVSDLVADALGKGRSAPRRKKDIKLQKRCWKRLLQLGSIDTCFLKELLRSDDFPAVMDDMATIEEKSSRRDVMRAVFKNLRYDGSGTFSRTEPSQCSALDALLSNMGSLVYCSLSMQDLDILKEPHARERAIDSTETWIDILFIILDDASSEVDWIIAGIVLASLCVPIINIQSKLFQLIKQECERVTTSTSASGVKFLLYSGVLGTVLRSEVIPEALNDLKAIVSAVCSRPLPFLSFCDMTEALFSLDWARETIISHAIDGLQRFIPNRVGDSGVLLDLYENAKCCLFVLLLFVSRPEWGKLEVRAWDLLSTIITSDTPQLPNGLRSWLQFQLQHSLPCRDARFIIQRVVRACLIKLLAIVDNDQDTLTERFSGQFELVFSLLDFDKSSDNFADGYLKLVSRWFEGDAVTGTEIRSLPFCPRKPGSLPDLRAVALVCMLQSIHPRDGLARVNACSFFSFRAVLNDLLVVERKVLGAISPRGCWPAWLRNGPCQSSVRLTWKPEFGRENTAVRWLLCDKLVELILWAKSHSADERDTSKLVGTVVRLQRHLKLLSGKRGLTCRRTTHDVERLLLRFGKFLDVMVPAGIALIGTESLKCADLVLHPVIDFCELVSECDKESLGILDCTIAQSWRLFLRLGSHESLLKLLSFLVKQGGKNEDERFCSMAVKDDDHVDEVLTKFRHSTLNVLSIVLKNQINAVDPQSLTANRAQSATIYLTILSKLGEDLRVALDGESGGLNYDCLDAYVKCIDDCSQRVVACLSDMEVAYVRRCSRACRKVSNYLRDILFTFALTRAHSRHKIFLLCWWTLPSVCRTVRYLLNEPLVCGDRAAGTGGKTAADILDDLNLVLRRKVHAQNVMGVEWTMIVGQEHISVEARGEDCPDTRLQNEIKPSKGSKPRKIVLETESAWVGVLRSTFDVIRKEWLESNSLMETGRVVTGTKKEDESSRAACFEERHRELAGSIRAMGSLLRCEKEITRDGVTGDHRCIDAAALPGRVKINLLGTLEIVLRVLLKSISGIISHVTTCEPAWKDEADDLGVNEMLCVFVAWLQLSDDLEILTGVQRWYLIESKLSAAEVKNGGTCKSESLVSRQWFTLLQLCDDVLAASKRLSDSLGGLNAQQEANIFAEAHFLVRSRDSHIKLATFADLLLVKVGAIQDTRGNLDRIFDCGLAITKRKRLSEGKGVRKTRRRSLRSRNEVVDNWLQLDELAGREESNADDVYAELEDFLVDG